MESSDEEGGEVREKVVFVGPEEDYFEMRSCETRAFTLPHVSNMGELSPSQESLVTELPKSGIMPKGQGVLAEKEGDQRMEFPVEDWMMIGKRSKSLSVIT